MTRVLPRRTVAAAALAAVALAGTAACGSESKPSASAVAAKLKNESEFSSLNDATLNCLANVLIKYGKASGLNKYVKDGNRDDVKISDSDETTVENESKDCATKYAGGSSSGS